MARTAASHIDDIEILYTLREHGWSSFRIFAGADDFHFNITHIFSEPMDDIIGLCHSLKNGVDSWIRLYDEPGATLICIAFDKKQRHLVTLSIYSSDSWEAEPETSALVGQYTMKSSQLLCLLVSQLQKVQTLCEEKSYQKDRPVFPRRAFGEFCIRADFLINPN